MRRRLMLEPTIYMLTNKRRGTLYTGVTSNLDQRVWQHKNSYIQGFTSRYGLKTLVWYESAETMYAAISREKQLKNWRRDWKIQLIEDLNPEWEDLWAEVC